MLAVVAFAACGSSPGAETPTPTPTPTPAAASPSPESSGTEIPVPQQVLAPANDPPAGNLCTTPITSTADGNATPLLCKSGAVNVEAWKFYANVSASILGLGLNPTSGQVQNAICDDLTHNHATRPQEASGYRLATVYYGWSFSVDPMTVTC